MYEPLPNHKWDIHNKYILEKSDWIENEDILLDWAENATFEKMPLDKIAITFIYVNVDHNVAGVAKTFIDLEKRERSSILHKSEFFNTVKIANNPKLIFDKNVQSECSFDASHPDVSREYHKLTETGWLEKTYIFEDAATFHVSNNHETIDNINPQQLVSSIQFHKDYEKIPSALLVFQDLFEIFVIMQEAKPISKLKSILKDGSTISKTKKVRISDVSPKEFGVSKINTVDRKRRTRKSTCYETLIS